MQLVLIKIVTGVLSRQREDNQIISDYIYYKFGRPYGFFS